MRFVRHEILTFGGADQAVNSGLPAFVLLLCLRQLHDVVSGIPERDERAPAGMRRSAP